MKGLALDSSPRYSETKSSTCAGHFRQPVIPGKAAGRDPESRSKHWIPACAGMTERVVSAFMLSAGAMGYSE